MSIYKVTPRQAKEYMIECMQAGLVPYLQGSPGIGKSSITNSIADECMLEMVDHRMITSPPEDLSGLPYFEDRPYGKVAAFAPFADLFPIEGMPIPPGKNGWFVFLDEFPSAKKDTQAACYKLILDRMTGQKRLHENVAIALAGNLMTDRALVNPLSTAMQSRIIHLELQVSYHDWLRDVALKFNYDPRIIAFISQYEEDLMTFRPDHKDKTFASPRTWEFMNRLIQGKDKIVEESTALYAGTIGEDIAVKFVQFTKVWQDVITIDEILKDPLSCRLPLTTDLMWATVSHMTSKITPKNFNALAAYSERFTMDMKVLFFRSALARWPALRHEPGFATAAVHLSKYLFED